LFTNKKTAALLYSCKKSEIKKCRFRIGVDDAKKLNKKEKEQEQEQVTIVCFAGCVARRLYRNSSSYLKHGMHGSAEK